jgi:hypothetical protein
MMHFLTKQEIIEELQSLPDLPVVVQLDSDAGVLEQVSSVDIIDVAINSGGDFMTPWNGISTTHTVILIS